MIINAPIMINKYHQCFFWSSIVRMKSGSREGRHECIAQANDRKYRLSLTTSIEWWWRLFFASYSAHLRSNANGKSEKQSIRTWTLVALRPATEAICWVAANIVFISRCKSVREWGIERAFRKFIDVMMDFFFHFLLARGGRDFFKQQRGERRGAPPFYFIQKGVCFGKEIRRAHGKGRDDVIVTGTCELLFRGREFVH